MAKEILLPINPEDLPHQAAWVAEQGSENPSQLANQVRDALFPGWQNYRNTPDLSKELYPFYRVICDTPEQALIAKRLKPAVARLEIISPQDLLPAKVEPTEENPISHPLIEKLKSVNPRYWTALNITLIGFGAMTLIDGVSAARVQDALTDPLLLVGAALSFAGMTMTAIRSGHMPKPKVQTSFDRNRNPKFLINIFHKN